MGLSIAHLAPTESSLFPTVTPLPSRLKRFLAASSFWLVAESMYSRLSARTPLERSTRRSESPDADCSHGLLASQRIRRLSSIHQVESSLAPPTTTLASLARPTSLWLD